MRKELSLFTIFSIIVSLGLIGISEDAYAAIYVKIPGLNRHKMPILPKVKEEQRIIRKSEILPLLDTS